VSVTGWAADKARKKIRGMTHPHHCDACNRSFRGHKALNAHHLGVHAQRWTSAKARKAARAMGKDVDRARRHARGWLEASGLLDPRGHLTPRAMSRPKPEPGRRGRTGVRQMRKLHVHGRDHDRADRHERKARKTRIPGRAARLQRKARDLRGRWPEQPRPAARPARPAPARPVPAPNGNGTRPAPARPTPAARPAATARTRPSRTGRTTR